MLKINLTNPRTVGGLLCANGRRDTRLLHMRGKDQKAGRAKWKKPGRTPCDAQPGWETALSKPDRSGQEFATPTTLLDHRQHPGDEREGAAASCRIDFGNAADPGGIHRTGESESDRVALPPCLAG